MLLAAVIVVGLIVADLHYNKLQTARAMLDTLASPIFWIANLPTRLNHWPIFWRWASMAPMCGRVTA